MQAKVSPQISAPVWTWDVAGLLEFYQYLMINHWSAALSAIMGLTMTIFNHSIIVMHELHRSELDIMERY